MTNLIFTDENIRKLLDGMKWETRRPVKRLRGIGPITEFDMTNGPILDFHCRDAQMRWHELSTPGVLKRAPHGRAGDLVWVREAFQMTPDGVAYRASENDLGIMPPGDSPRWRPSIHMPRWASRMTLRIIRVRVERLQDIDDDGAKAEGQTSRGRFAGAWDNLYDQNGPRGWRANPWVWVYRFDVLRQNIDMVTT